MHPDFYTFNYMKIHFILITKITFQLYLQQIVGDKILKSL